MTWTIHASGHTPAPDGETGWHGVEQKLFAELQAVLSKPEFGAANSSFHGNHVDGEPHVSPEESTTTQHCEPETVVTSGVAPNIAPHREGDPYSGIAFRGDGPA